jgi:hypothetical protein
MNNPLISHGAPDEVFVMGDIGVQLDVATLISRVNAAPRAELDIREGATADLISIARRNSFDRFKVVSTERLEEPLLLVTLRFYGQRQFWIVDGTHRLHARHRSGKPKTRYVAVASAMVHDLVQPRRLY